MTPVTPSSVEALIFAHSVTGLNKQVWFKRDEVESIVRAALAERTQQEAQPSGSDKDFWVKGRSSILLAIEKAGFLLMSNKDGFFLHRAARPTSAANQQEANIIQAITDPENQPSQYGTVTIDYHLSRMTGWEERFERVMSRPTSAADCTAKIIPCNCEFDAWHQNPYTKVLMKSISEDYVPKADCTAPMQPSDYAGEHDVCPLCSGSGSITYGPEYDADCKALAAPTQAAPAAQAPKLHPEEAASPGSASCKSERRPAMADTSTTETSEREAFEAHLKTAAWHQVMVQAKDDDDDSASIYRMCRMAAREAWIAALASQPVTQSVEPVDIDAPNLYRKRPLVVEAHQMTSDGGRFAFLMDWVGDEVKEWDDEPYRIRFRSLEGEIWASEGDWIINGIEGEFYPCSASVFAASYEAAPQPSVSQEAAK